MAEVGRYFGRKEISLIFQSELPAHGTNIGVKVLALRGDYSKDAVAGKTTAGDDRPQRPRIARSCPRAPGPGGAGHEWGSPRFHEALPGQFAATMSVQGEGIHRAAKPATALH